MLNPKIRPFIGNAEADRINDAVNSMDLPPDLVIRGARSGDIAAIGSLDAMGDTIYPQYGMSEGDEENAITLVAEIDGRPIGQACGEIEILGQSMTRCELSVSGIFVAKEHRGKGFGETLGEALLRVVKSWRRDVAKKLGRPDLLGEVEIAADTEPESGGAAIIDRMEYLSMELSDEAFALGEESTGPTPA